MARWTREELQEHIEAGANRLMSEVSRTRFDFRHVNARLVDTHTGKIIAGAPDNLRAELRSNEAINMLSIRVEVRDNKRRGKLMETWLRCALIQRVITRVKPTREGISHDRYTVLIAYLVARGLVEPDQRNGYQWTDAYKSLARRADWLIELTRREGELHHARAAARFTVAP